MTALVAAMVAARALVRQEWGARMLLLLLLLAMGEEGEKEEGEKGGPPSCRGVRRDDDLHSIISHAAS